MKGPKYEAAHKRLHAQGMYDAYSPSFDIPAVQQDYPSQCPQGVLSRPIHPIRLAYLVDTREHYSLRRNPTRGTFARTLPRGLRCGNRRNVSSHLRALYGHLDLGALPGKKLTGIRTGGRELRLPTCPAGQETHTTLTHHQSFRTSLPSIALGN